MGKRSSSSSSSTNKRCSKCGQRLLKRSRNSGKLLRRRHRTQLEKDQEETIANLKQQLTMVRKAFIEYRRKHPSPTRKTIGRLLPNAWIPAYGRYNWVHEPS